MWVKSVKWVRAFSFDFSSIKTYVTFRFGYHCFLKYYTGKDISRIKSMILSSPWSLTYTLAELKSIF